MHDTHNGLVIAYQGDIDGKFAISVDEFLGAVERVNQPVLLPVLAGFPRDVCGFF